MRKLDNVQNLSFHINFKIGKIWLSSDGEDLDISLQDDKLKENTIWYPTFLLHKKG